jgi:hypothetical protein
MKIGVSDWIDDLAHSNRRTLSIGSLKLPWPWPVAYGLHGSSAVVFGWPVHGDETPRLISWLAHAFRRISDGKFWLFYRLHPGHRYHMIDTGLGYGYHERDEQLLYGAMACLIGYVEDCERTGCHDPGDKARAIMHWWRVQRPADQAQHAQWMNELYSGKGRLKTKPVEGQPKLQEIVFEPLSEDDAAKQKAMWELERKIRADEQKFLHILVNIRPGMWT